LRNNQLLQAILPTAAVGETEAVDEGGARVRARAGVKVQRKDAACRTHNGQKRSRPKSLHAPHATRVPRPQRNQQQLNSPSLRLLFNQRRGQLSKLARRMRCRGRRQLAMALNPNAYRLSVGIEVLLEEFAR
jgi:hypothetical protein